MKKHILTLVACCVAAAGVASQAQEKKLQVALKSGSTVEYKVSEIDHLSFATVEETPGVDANAVYSFEVPTDFSKNRIMKVMVGDDKIAEVCREYVLACDAVLTVVYPMGEDGKADLTKGVNTADGGSVVWDYTTNKATITEGTGAVTKMYVANGELKFTVDVADEAIAAQVQPDLLIDTRKTSGGMPVITTYTTTKVGTQYWMAQNLSAKYYNDGTEIPYFKADEGASWNDNTTGACHIWNDNSDLTDIYGCLYNAYALTNEAGLAPEGWEIPTNEQWTALRTAANKKPAYLKSDDMIFWGEEYAGTDETGFSAYPCGYFSNGTGEAADTEGYWWTSTSYYDKLYKYDVWDYVRITPKGTSVVISTSLSGGHAAYIGHSVRCIRK
jgi:uncharacterized protein (TIGR02145 family)